MLNYQRVYHIQVFDKPNADHGLEESVGDLDVVFFTARNLRPLRVSLTLCRNTRLGPIKAWPDPGQAELE